MSGHLPFRDEAQRRDTAQLGMWAFLVTEVLFFGALFTGYALYRMAYPHSFIEGSHHLDPILGGVNTAVLIGSSLTMALAVRSASLGQRKPLIGFLAATIVLGAAFLGVKLFEYAHKYHEGLIPGIRFLAHGEASREMQLFFSFYFVMTGFHALHMVIGIGLLAVLAVMAHLGKLDPPRDTMVDMTGLYWHFVDLVWIFLFPMLYLLGRHG